MKIKLGKFISNQQLHIMTELKIYKEREISGLMKKPEETKKTPF